MVIMLLLSLLKLVSTFCCSCYVDINFVDDVATAFVMLLVYAVDDN